MNETINEIVLEIARVQSTILYFQRKLRDLETSLDVTVQLKMSGQIVTKEQVLHEKAPATTPEKKKSVREIVLEAIKSGVPRNTAALRKACLQKYPEEALRIKTNISCIFAKLREEGTAIETSHPRKERIALNGEHHEEITIRT